MENLVTSPHRALYKHLRRSSGKEPGKNLSKNSRNPQGPSVSVVLSFYEGREYLDEQLESIACQSYRPTELIFIEDGGHDCARDILKRYESGFKRVQYFRREKSLGCNASFIDAMSRASCPYIAISDQDDIWHTGKLEQLVEALVSQEASLAFGRSELIDAQGREHGCSLQDVWMRKSGQHSIFSQPLGNLTNRWLGGGQWPQLIADNCVSGHAMLIDREFFIKLDCSPLRVVARSSHELAVSRGYHKRELLSVKESELEHSSPFKFHWLYDQYLALMALALGQGIIYCPQAITYHRIHRSNSHNSALGGDALGSALSSERSSQLRIKMPHQKLFSAALSDLRYVAPSLASSAHYQALEALYGTGEAGRWSLGRLRLWARVQALRHLAKSELLSVVLGKKRGCSKAWKIVKLLLQ